MRRTAFILLFVGPMLEHRRETDKAVPNAVDQLSMLCAGRATCRLPVAGVTRVLADEAAVRRRFSSLEPVAHEADAVKRIGVDLLQGYLFGRPSPALAFDAAVISDLGMPNMDGHAVATAVKTAAPDTPFVLLTGWGQSFGEVEPPEHVDRVLSKPPKLVQLRAVLAELV